MQNRDWLEDNELTKPNQDSEHSKSVIIIEDARREMIQIQDITGPCEELKALLKHESDMLLTTQGQIALTREFVEARIQNFPIQVIKFQKQGHPAKYQVIANYETYNLARVWYGRFADKPIYLPCRVIDSSKNAKAQALAFEISQILMVTNQFKSKKLTGLVQIAISKADIINWPSYVFKEIPDMEIEREEAIKTLLPLLGIAHRHHKRFNSEE